MKSRPDWLCSVAVLGGMLASGCGSSEPEAGAGAAEARTERLILVAEARKAGGPERAGRVCADLLTRLLQRWAAEPEPDCFLAS